MERLKALKEKILSLAEGSNLECADTEEFGQVVDMIKDLSQAIYYCTITESMEENKKENEMMEKLMSKMGSNMQSQQMPVYYTEQPRHGRMYYPTLEYKPEYEIPYEYPNYFYSSSNGGGRNPNSVGGGIPSNPVSGSNGNSRNYSNGMRDSREGRNGMSRRMYMESKEAHQDPAIQSKHLDDFILNLKEDIAEMIKDAEPAHKQKLQQDFMSLSHMIEKM